MSPWAAAAVMVLLVWTVAVAIGRVRRLDRLHRRLDATRQGLAAALEARWDAVERVGDCSRVTSLRPRRSDVTLLRRGLGEEREVAENALSRALAGVDRAALPVGLREELAEAELRLVLARHMHNDAVRDTLALRSRRLVRWLHLAGTAPMPAYFEIADPPGVLPGTRAAPRG